MPAKTKAKVKATPGLNSYHFSLGDSSEGPIGFCARVTARTRDEALALLKKELDEHDEVEVFEGSVAPEKPCVEYVRAYINGDAVTVKDIDEVEAV